MSESAAVDAANAVAAAMGEGAAAVEHAFGTVTVTVPRARWFDAARAARRIGFDVLDWLTGVDEPEATGGPAVDVVAMLVRTEPEAAAVLLRTRLREGEALPSLTGLVRSAAWHERETAEMLGIEVSGFSEPTPEGLVTTPRPLLTARWDPPPDVPPLRAAAALARRGERPWPGAREPVEPSDLPPDAHRRRATGRRPVPPGVPPAAVPPASPPPTASPPTAAVPPASPPTAVPPEVAP